LSKDMMDLKSKTANKLDIVLKVKKKDSEKSNDKEEDANMIENNYEKKVNEIYKEKIDYEAEEKVNKMYREDIERADQIDRAKFNRN
ncbi:12253_t:CDS:2, partial [Cetraspora pellucida]